MIYNHNLALFTLIKLRPNVVVGKKGWFTFKGKRIEFFVKEVDSCLSGGCSWFWLDGDRAPQRTNNDPVRRNYLNISTCPEEYPCKDRDLSPEAFHVERSKIHIEDLL